MLIEQTKLYKAMQDSGEFDNDEQIIAKICEMRRDLLRKGGIHPIVISNWYKPSFVFDLLYITLDRRTA